MRFVAVSRSSATGARVHAVDGGVVLKELNRSPVGGLVALPSPGSEGSGEATARLSHNGLRGKGLPVENHGGTRVGGKGSSLHTSLTAQLYTGFVLLILLDESLLLEVLCGDVLGVFFVNVHPPDELSHGVNIRAVLRDVV